MRIEGGFAKHIFGVLDLLYVVILCDSVLFWQCFRDSENKNQALGNFAVAVAQKQKIARGLQHNNLHSGVEIETSRRISSKT